jgi:hypothetical protein
LFCGSYFGEAYRDSFNPDFETFLEQVVEQVRELDFRIISPKPTGRSFVHISTGVSGKRRIVFVCFQKDYSEARVLFKKGFLKSSTLRDIVTDSERSVEQVTEGNRIIVPTNDLGVAVLVGE